MIFKSVPCPIVPFNWLAAENHYKIFEYLLRVSFSEQEVSWLRSHCNKYFTKSQTIYDIDTKQREIIIDRLLIPISAKLVALPTKRDIESSIQVFQEKVALVQERIERVQGNFNDMSQYIRRLDLHIF